MSLKVKHQRTNNRRLLFKSGSLKLHDILNLILCKALFAETSCFLPKQTAFRQNKLLFAETSCFSQKQAAFRRNKLLFAETSCFSPKQAAFCQNKLLFAKTSCFSQKQAAFRQNKLLFAKSALQPSGLMLSAGSYLYICANPDDRVCIPISSRKLLNQTRLIIAK